MCVCVIFNSGTLRMMFSQRGEYVTGLFCKHIILNHVFSRYKSSGRKIRGSSGGYGVLLFHAERTHFKLAVTSSNQFLLVVAYDR